MAEDMVPNQGASRRRWLLSAALAGGLGSAVGIAWWRSRPVEGDESEGAAALAPFWATDWKDPQGQALAVAQFKGKPLLLNFWATWCPPCVEELPLLNAFYRQNRTNGWQVLGLALDRVDMVQKFLHHNPLDFPVAMAGLGGSELARGLGNVAGALPFTVVVNSAGGIAQRKLGRVTAENLQQWAGLK